jgi:hypothetical protein
MAGHLNHLLPAHAWVGRVRHHPALPRQLVGDEKFDAAWEIAKPLGPGPTNGRDMARALE